MILGFIPEGPQLAGLFDHKKDLVIFNNGIRKEISIFIGRCKIRNDLIKVRIRLFRDSTHKFNEISLKQIIIAPFKEVFANGFKSTLAFEGYLVEIYFSNLKLSNLTDKGFLDIGSNEVYIPYVEILTHRQIRESLFTGARIIKESPEVIEKG